MAPPVHSAASAAQERADRRGTPMGNHPVRAMLDRAAREVPADYRRQGPTHRHRKRLGRKPTATERDQTQVVIVIAIHRTARRFGRAVSRDRQRPQAPAIRRLSRQPPQDRRWLTASTRPLILRLRQWQTAIVALLCRRLHRSRWSTPEPLEWNLNSVPRRQ